MAACAMAWWLRPSPGPGAATSPVVQTGSPPATPAPSALADAEWDRLSSFEQRMLEPLKGMWSTLPPQQRHQWRLVVDHMQARPPRQQHLLAVRIEQWARMSPEQRTRARLNFLEAAGRYTRKQRQEQWQAYQALKSRAGQAQAPSAQPLLVPPALARATPGATTVLLSQLFRAPAADDVSELDEGATALHPAEGPAPPSSEPASSTAGEVVPREDPGH